MREVECLSQEEKVALVKEELMTPGGKWLDILRTRTGETLVLALLQIEEFGIEEAGYWQKELTRFCELLREIDTDRIRNRVAFKMAAYTHVGDTVINVGLVPYWNETRGKGVWLNFHFYSGQLQRSFDGRHEQEYDRIFKMVEAYKRDFFERLARAIVEIDSTLAGWAPN